MLGGKGRGGGGEGCGRRRGEDAVAVRGDRRVTGEAGGAERAAWILAAASDAAAGLQNR